MLRQYLAILLHHCTTLEIIDTRRVLRLRLILLKRIFLPYLYEIVFRIRQAGGIIILLRQQIRMKSGIAGHRPVAVPRRRFFDKSGIIPMHIEIAVIDDTRFLCIDDPFDKQLSVPAQHIVHRAFLHPVFYRYDLRRRRKRKQPLPHRRVVLQVLTAADEDEIDILRVHLFHDPFYHRSAHYPDKRL